MELGLGGGSMDEGGLVSRTRSGAGTVSDDDMSSGRRFNDCES